ncbi:MAG TPA: RluA family pseudouridine synthase [Candidatus Sulfotelmatobacter sp.]|jgi:23S rRNA pseudouridine1911/1915/1917 synthase|nr:RluA family pseudouridine synthase [Candidatus Sulfotelmatobacter sp.]
MNIATIFEDESLAVVNKPAGVTVNRAETTKNEETVQDWTEKQFGIPYKETNTKFGDEEWKPEDEFYKRGGIVHRLDKETSGVLLVAKTPQAFVDLQKQFRERTVKKVYTALAHGSIIPKVGEVHVPVGRLPWNRNRFGVLPGGRESKTLYTVLDYFLVPHTKEKVSLVELYPQSGRTHQIRVHLQYLNHPIFADFLYAGRKTARADRQLVSRVFLHAAKISFLHPVTGKHVSYEAPLAIELEQFLQKLEKLPL